MRFKWPDIRQLGPEVRLTEFLRRRGGYDSLSELTDEEMPRSRLALLLERFSRLDDERRRWRAMYPLSEMLLLSTCATIAGCDDLDEIVARGLASNTSTRLSKPSTGPNTPIAALSTCGFTSRRHLSISGGSHGYWGVESMHWPPGIGFKDDPCASVLLRSSPIRPVTAPVSLPCRDKSPPPIIARSYEKYRPVWHLAVASHLCGLALMDNCET